MEKTTSSVAFRKQWFPVLLLLAGLTCAQGCADYQVRIPDSDPLEQNRPRARRVGRATWNTSTGRSRMAGRCAWPVLCSGWSGSWREAALGGEVTQVTAEVRFIGGAI